VSVPNELLTGLVIGAAHKPSGGRELTLSDPVWIRISDRKVDVIQFHSLSPPTGSARRPIPRIYELRRRARPASRNLALADFAEDLSHHGSPSHFLDQ